MGTSIRTMVKVIEDGDKRKDDGEGDQGWGPASVRL